MNYDPDGFFKNSPKYSDMLHQQKVIRRLLIAQVLISILMFLIVCGSISEPTILISLAVGTISIAVLAAAGITESGEKNGDDV
ncbi:MAG TPA: hypothetical protein VHP31_00900 [Caproicibacter sp.]|nr:hypothetical protein [Caproicibacter sp.]